MKRITLIGIGLVALALAGAIGFNWWSHHQAIAGAKTASINRVIGNPQGRVTIVEFVDYQCQYCLTLHQRLSKVIDADKDVRLVFRALPWLSGSGELAAFVVAAGKQGKEIELHKALLSQPAPANIMSAKRIAQGLGIDVARAEQDQQDPVVRAVVTENLNYAMALHLQSTPALLIGNTLYMPAADALPTVNQLKLMIEDEKGKN